MIITYIEDCYCSARLLDVMLHDIDSDAVVNIFTHLKGYNGCFDEDYFFIDNHLPDGKGLQFILQNIQKFNLTKTKLILITAGYLKNEEEESIKRIPNFSILRKPFTAKELQTLITKNVRQ